MEGRGKKLIEFIHFKLDFPNVGCENCERLMELEEDFAPNCDDCKLPVLSSANERAWELYWLINNQLVIDNPAILPLVLEAYGPLRLSRVEAQQLINKLILIHNTLKKHTENTGRYGKQGRAGLRSTR